MSKKEITLSNELLTMAARLCYVDKVPQQQAAAMLNISQAKVSRLLAIARERGIIRITVADYEPRHNGLEERLRAKYGFKDVIVIRLQSQGTPQQRRNMLGYFAAPYMNDRLSHETMVGLAGGRTIQALIEAMPEGKNARGMVAVQIMGNADSLVRPFDASELGRMLAQRLHGTFLALNTPVFAPDFATRESFLRHEQITEVIKAFRNLNAALVGIGIPENSIFTSSKLLNAERIKALRESGVVGEICGRFFDDRGSECATEFRDRVIGIELDVLRGVKQCWGVVSGTDRTRGIAAAVRGGVINALVIDETGAAALLEY